MAEKQNYQNHARYYPLVHFILLPILLFNLIWQAVRLYQEPSWDRAEWVLVSVALIGLNIAARFQALKAQDRTIVLEEMIRYGEILPPGLTDRARQLDANKIIALRFASAEELPDLVQKTLDGELKTSKDIKLAVKNWRGDYLRV